MAKSIMRRVTKKFFVAANLLTSLLFLMGCYGYWFNPAYFWPVGFLTLISFYLFLLLLAFILFWLFAKPALSLISIVAILAAYEPLHNILPPRFSYDFNKQKPRGTLRVMSWNVAQFNVLKDKKEPYIKQEMINLVKDYGADVACFQEMVAEDSTVKTHGHIDTYLDQLKIDSTNYFYSYNRKEDFWDYAHFGLIIFSKYPIINKQTVAWYPNDYNSIIQYVDIVKNKDTVRVFNVHLQSLRFSRANLKYIDAPTVESDSALTESRNIIGKFKKGFLKRKIQADRIKAEINKSPYRVVVCGDFNDVPNSYAYYTIGEGMQNTFVEKGGGLGRTFSGISPVLRIDNIFAGNQFDVLQFTRIPKKLSDHFPIVTDLRLIKK